MVFRPQSLLPTAVAEADVYSREFCVLLVVWNVWSPLCGVCSTASVVLGFAFPVSCLVSRGNRCFWSPLCFTESESNSGVCFPLFVRRLFVMLRLHNPAPVDATMQCTISNSELGGRASLEPQHHGRVADAAHHQLLAGSRGRGPDERQHGVRAGETFCCLSAVSLQTFVRAP